MRGIVLIAPKCRISRARVVGAGRIISGGAISGMQVGFHLLRRAGYGEPFIADVARVREYKAYSCIGRILNTKIPRDRDNGG